MGRLLFILTAALIVSALSLVTSQYQGRSLYVELERAQVASRELDVQWRRLQLDQTEHAKQAQIDRVAKGQLKMDGVTPARTIYLARQGDQVAFLPYGPSGKPPPPKAKGGRP